MFTESTARFRRVGMCTGACIFAFAAVGHAQLRAAVDVNAAVSRFDGVPANANATTARWLDQRAISTMLRLDHRFGQLSANGVLRDGEVATRATGGFMGLLETPSLRGFRLSTSVEVRHSPNDGGAFINRDTLSLALWARSPKLPAWGAQSSARLLYARGVNAAWLSATDRRGAYVSDSVSSLFLSTGYSRQIRDVVVGFTIGSQSVRTPGTPAQFRDTTFYRPRTDSGGRSRVDTISGIVGDSGVAGGLHRWAEVAGRIAWARGRFAFDAVINARPKLGGYSSAVWGQATGVAAVGSRVALVGGLRTVAPLPGVVTAPRRSLNLGLRIAPAALWRAPDVAPIPAALRAFDVQRSAPGEYTVTVRLPNARVVELAGDFTGWKPVQLRQVDASRWEITLPVAAGSHRCNLRINGAEWVAPPGVTAIDDEFNGRVGLFVVD